MDQNLSLIKELISTLKSEIETINYSEESADWPVSLSAKVREYEIKLIQTALIKTRGNQAKAARLLNTRTTTLHHKIKHYGIDVFKQHIPYQ